MMNFDDLDICDDIKSAIAEMGFKNMTPIQKRAIPEALSGKDVIGQAQTGTGKTVAFSIPILERIFIPDRSPQAIILCPTRELSIQVAEEISKIGKNIKKLKVLAVYGGQPIGKQTRVLKKGVHIVVGTPGRVIDHIERGNLDLIGVERVVLDEADEMLDMGFRDDIELILNKTPHQRQTLLFSATIPNEVKTLAKKYQKNPKFVKIASNKKNIPKITQYSFKTSNKTKFNDLCKLIDAWDIKLALIFSNTKKGVDFLSKNLKKNGYSVDSIHGDMTQKIRDKVMNKFRNGNINILVATDVAARGIDVDDIEVVINYDVPQNPENYIHRIGRTARAGNRGYAFTLVTPQDNHNLVNIKKKYKVKITEKNVPSSKEIENIKNKRVIDEAIKIAKKEDLNHYIKVIESNSKGKVSSVELAAALLKMVRKN